MKDSWFTTPMVQSGVMETHNEYQEGPQYAVGVVSLVPHKLINMNLKLQPIIREFHEDEDSSGIHFCYHEEHVNWRMAGRNGEEVVHIARQMQETPGVRWLNIYPWGMFAKGWYGTEHYFPDILSKMKMVLKEMYGDIEFVDVPNREMFFPVDTKTTSISSEFDMTIPMTGLVTS